MTFHSRTIFLLATLCGAASLTFSCSTDDAVIPLEKPAAEPDEVPLSACGSDLDCREVGGLCDLARAVCTPACENSLDCREAEVCDSAKGHCVMCVQDNDCSGGNVCRGSLCGTACNTSTDCGGGMDCSPSGLCVPQAGGDGDGDSAGGAPGEGGSSGDGDGDVNGDGDVSGDGDGDGDVVSCAPEVKVLLQRSGAVFENPSADDSWWAAVSDALSNADDGLVAAYADRLDISVSTFHMTAESCPIMSETVDADGDLAQFFADEQTAHEESGVKIDAPLPEAIADAAGSFTRADNRHILLVVSGNPDSCAQQDGVCAIAPSIEALQTAHLSGITTKVLYLSSSDAYDGYEQALANAGAGEPVAEMNGLMNSCDAASMYFSETGGSAPYQAPNSTSEVRASFGALLDSIGSCQ